MNKIDVSVLEGFYSVDEEAEDDVKHYGTKFHSGRYPYGSGEDPYQHDNSFLGEIKRLKDSGWEETTENIREHFGMSTQEYRRFKSVCETEKKIQQRRSIKAMRSDGLSNSEIAKKLGLPGESSVRSLMNEKAVLRTAKAEATADFIEQRIKETGGMIDVGVGTNINLKITPGQMNLAVDLLQARGYQFRAGRIPQPTNPNQMTTMNVIGPKDLPKNALYVSPEKIHGLEEYTSDDGGSTFRKFQFPASLDSKRLKILLADDINPLDGEKGIDKDGLIQIRRGMKDLNLGNDNYSQVRILVDDNKYLKGMCTYADNMPEGVDVIFNSNKTSYAKALKDIEKDPTNPFGATIAANGQSTYIGDDGKEHLNLVNKRALEGDWSDWSDSVPTQFLAKQPVALAKTQIDATVKQKMDEFNEIMSLEQPTVKKYYLNKFAQGCDSNAESMKTVAFPGQKYHVIVPVNTLADDEVYAPRYPDGTKLALVRYPHAGRFEIPILTVNNKNKTARNAIGTNPSDALCINKKNADLLSGADFDGDTVMAIPAHNGKIKIANQKPLKGLVDFEPKTAYGADPDSPKITYGKNGEEIKHYYRNGEEFHVMSKTAKGRQMGVISNLITDMTLMGANEDELARAVRHSMVVIDAEKHKLDYRASEIENDIDSLKRRYQKNPTPDKPEHYGGASTIFSRATSTESVPKRQGQPKINLKDKPWYDPDRPEGALIFKEADDAHYIKTKYDKQGNVVSTTNELRTVKVSRMSNTDNPSSLMSTNPTDMERLYAGFASQLKSLANQARKELATTGNVKYSDEAADTYKDEVDSLMKKLEFAESNKPKERLATARAAADVKARRDELIAEFKANGMNDKQIAKELKAMKKKLSKYGQQKQSEYRSQFGSKSRRERNMDITDREWEAIMRGAINETTMNRILNNSDPDILRSRAMPRATTTLTPAKISRIRSMASSSNKSLNDIAKALGVSVTTVSNVLKGGV